MISDTIARQLHDRFTRGQTLSLEEQSLLETWYALQDQVENETLSIYREENHLTALKMQVTAALTQLLAVTKQIQTVTAENERLKLGLNLTAMKRSYGKYL